MKKPQYPGDVVIYITIIALALLSFVFPFIRTAPDDTLTVVISYDEICLYLPLSEDAAVPVTTADGHTLTVHINAGSVCVTDADCPDKLCMRTGKIDRSGAVIACVPAGVLIEIEGGASDADIILG